MKLQNFSFNKMHLKMLFAKCQTVCPGFIVLTPLPRDKMAAILADDIFKCIFLNENDRILIQISLKFVPRIPIDNKAVLVQVMAWCRAGTKPLSKTMMVTLLTHICVTRPQWVKRAGSLIHIVLTTLFHKMGLIRHKAMWHTRGWHQTFMSVFTR